MKNKMDQEYSFALRPASIEEAGLFYFNDEQDEALGTVGHLRLDFGHGFLPLRSTCYPHNDDQFDTLEFKMLLREFLEAMQENGPLASLSSMKAYCQKHGGAITEDGRTYGYIWETERYRFCLRCTPSPFEYQGHLYCYDLWQQQIQKNCPVGQVTYASGEQQTFTVVQHYLQTIREELPYEDEKYHNVVFVGKDETGIARHAHKRSTNSTGKAFRQNVEGSDPRYSFHHLGRDGSLFVFEAPIDLLSYLTLYSEDWKEHSYVACCGTSPIPVLTMLQQMKTHQAVYLCLDNDRAGHEASLRMAEQIGERFNIASDRLTPEQKDWNDDLCVLRETPGQGLSMEMR